MTIIPERIATEDLRRQLSSRLEFYPAAGARSADDLPSYVGAHLDGPGNVTRVDDLEARSTNDVGPAGNF